MKSKTKSSTFKGAFVSCRVGVATQTPTHSSIPLKTQEAGLGVAGVGGESTSHSAHWNTHIHAPPPKEHIHNLHVQPIPSWLSKWQYTPVQQGHAAIKI